MNTLLTWLYLLYHANCTSFIGDLTKAGLDVNIVSKVSENLFCTINLYTTFNCKNTVV